MSIGLVDNVGKSFVFAYENTVKKLLRWIGLSIVFWIPIANFITAGIFLKVYRGEEPDFSNAGKSFIQGLLLFVIQFIYALIPALIIILSALFSMTELSVITLIGLLAGLILAVLLGFFMFPVIVNFARRQTFGSAFAFGEIFSMIGKLGLAKFVLAWILYIVVMFVVSFVLGILFAVPLIGAILMLLSVPFILFFEAKYFSNLFE